MMLLTKERRLDDHVVKALKFRVPLSQASHVSEGCEQSFFMAIYIEITTQ